MTKIHLFLISIALFAVKTVAADTNSIPVTITVDAGKPIGGWKPIWRFFGADEPNYAYMKDGKKLLGELGDIGRENHQQVYFRAHHLLTSGDGAYSLKFGSTSAYKEDANGNPVYDWTINDKIFDTYLASGVKPYVQIGFMPEALSTHPQNYPHNPPKNERAPVAGGQSYPPKDYVKWGNLSYEWAKHCVEKYGQTEVAQWYWEVWNEANLNIYWHGSREDYFKLYDFAVDGVRRALPSAQVGGPEVAGGTGGTFLEQFLQHCATGTNYVTGKIGSPLDFISFHAKGSPGFVNGHVRMGMAGELRNMDGAFSLIASIPQFKNLPIVIGECDPDTCAACLDPQFGYRNTTMYSSYTAACFPRALELAQKYGVNLQGTLTWAFEFEDQPAFVGYRSLATDGLDLPVLNVFRMFGKMSGQQIAATSSASLDAGIIMSRNVREQPDISALASLDKSKLAVLVWYYHDDDVPGPDAAIDLELNGIPLANGEATMTHYRVDADHSDSYAVWKSMGSPQPPTPEQYATLEKAGQLATLGSAVKVQVADHKATIHFNLPREGVSLVVLDLP